MVSNRSKEGNSPNISDRGSPGIFVNRVNPIETNFSIGSGGSGDQHNKRRRRPRREINTDLDNAEVNNSVSDDGLST